MTSHILSTLFKAQALLTVPDQGVKPGPERGAVDRNTNEICFEESYLKHKTSGNLVTGHS